MFQLGEGREEGLPALKQLTQTTEKTMWEWEISHGYLGFPQNYLIKPRTGTKPISYLLFSVFLHLIHKICDRLATRPDAFYLQYFHKYHPANQKHKSKEIKSVRLVPILWEYL